MSYSIFVRFRKSRLPLARRIESLDAALEALALFRRERLHNADHVFVVDDATGEAIPDAEPPMEAQ